MTKYTIVERLKSNQHPEGGSVFQPQQNTGKRWLFPAFDTLRDAHIYMGAIRKDYKTGIVGNVSIEYLKDEGK